MIKNSRYNQFFLLLYKRGKDKPEFAGSGIGLATCKRMVNYIGGGISVQSTEHVVTIFNFTIKVQSKKGNNTYEIFPAD